MDALVRVSVAGGLAVCSTRHGGRRLVRMRYDTLFWMYDGLYHASHVPALQHDWEFTSSAFG